MKSYCKNCETIQPSSFRPCTDVVTGASYEDLCCDSCHYIVATIEERKALAQPAQESVAHFGSAYINENGVHITTVLGPVAIPQDAKLYTAPPQRKPLTDEDLDLICEKALFCRISFQQFARSIEAAHGIKEKNT
jgi:hypothetical protein